MKKKFLSLIILIFSCSNETKKKPVKKKITSIGYSKRAKLKSFSHKIKVQGNVLTDKDILLNSEMSGLVTQMHVSPKYCKKGQPILSMDESMINSVYRRIGILEYAEYMFNKQNDLFKKG